MGLRKALKNTGLALLAFWAGGEQAWAGWSLIPAPRFQSGREAALGGAYLPIGEDVASALFNNPADVARFKNSHLDTLNVIFYGNRGYTDTLSFGMNGTNLLDVFALGTSANTLYSNPYRLSGAGVSVMSGYAFKNLFAVGLLWQTNVAAYSDGSNVTYRSLYQLIPTASVGTRLASGIVRIGYNVQWVSQAVTPKAGITLAHGSTSMSYTNQLYQGSGLSHNAGFAMTLPIAMLPSFNLVARNILGTTYSMPSLLTFSPNSPGAPPSDPMSFDASFSLQPKLGSGMYMNWVMEYRDISNTSGVAPLGRFCLGMELSFADRFFVRAGWGANYPSMGIGLRYGKGDINLTYYNEEYGVQYNSFREPRFLGQFLIRAF